MAAFNLQQLLADGGGLLNSVGIKAPTTPVVSNPGLLAPTQTQTQVANGVAPVAVSNATQPFTPPTGWTPTWSTAGGNGSGQSADGGGTVQDGYSSVNPDGTYNYYDMNGNFLRSGNPGNVGIMGNIAQIGALGTLATGAGLASGLIGAPAAAAADALTPTAAAWGSGAGLGADTLGAMGLPSTAAELGAGATGLLSAAPEVASTAAPISDTAAAWSAPSTGADTLSAMGAPSTTAELGAAGTLGTGAASAAGTTGAGKVATSLTGNSFLDSLINGDGSSLGGTALASLLGGVLGSQGQKSTVSKTDPRYDPYIYGSGGILPAAQQWYQKNQSGMNPLMQQGLDTQTAAYKNSIPGYQSMQNLGLGMIGQGVAANPFTTGAASLNGAPKSLLIGK